MALELEPIKVALNRLLKPKSARDRTSAAATFAVDSVEYVEALIAEVESLRMDLAAERDQIKEHWKLLRELCKNFDHNICMSCWKPFPNTEKHSCENE